MKYLLLFVLAAIVLDSVLVLGQEKDQKTKEATAEKVEELRRSGLEALYNLDYSKAQRDFNEIVKLDPANPTGPQLLAARVWVKTLYESSNFGKASVTVAALEPDPVGVISWR